MSNKVKYMVHPDHLIQGDKTSRFITAEEIMLQHKVNPEDCCVGTYDEERDSPFKRTDRGTQFGGVINLYADEEFNYGMVQADNVIEGSKYDYSKL